MITYLFTPTARKRQIFDQVGEEGLKRGGGDFSGSGYTFTGDPREIFSQFFGPGGNPFEDIMGGMFGGGSGGATGFNFSSGSPGAGGSPFMFKTSKGGGAEGMDFTDMGGFSGMGGHSRRQDPPIQHDLNLSLEDLYNGCTKKMKIKHQVLLADNQTSHEDKILEINVKPGWKAGTKIKFEKEGDQKPGRIAADIVFVVKEKPHSQFKRDGNNLRHTAKITLKQALCGGNIRVPTIRGKSLDLPLSQVVTPDTVEVIAGEGMPISKEPGKYGNLLVGFDIQFPKSLSNDKKKELSKILPS